MEDKEIILNEEEVKNENNENVDYSSQVVAQNEQFDLSSKEQELKEREIQIKEKELELQEKELESKRASLEKAKESEAKTFGQIVSNTETDEMPRQAIKQKIKSSVSSKDWRSILNFLAFVSVAIIGVCIFTASLGFSSSFMTALATIGNTIAYFIVAIGGIFYVKNRKEVWIWIVYFVAIVLIIVSYFI